MKLDFALHILSRYLDNAKHSLHLLFEINETCNPDYLTESVMEIHTMGTVLALMHRLLFENEDGLYPHKLRVALTSNAVENGKMVRPVGGIIELSEGLSLISEHIDMQLMFAFCVQYLLKTNADTSPDDIGTLFTFAGEELGKSKAAEFGDYGKSNLMLYLDIESALFGTLNKTEKEFALDNTETDKRDIKMYN